MAEPDLVGIVVRDMKTSLQFYRLLDLEIYPEADTESHVEVTMPGGFRIAWDTVELIKSIYGEWPEAQGHRMSLAFKCPSPAEVDALYQRVIEAGYHGHKSPWDTSWGQRYAVVEDPDGNLVELFAELT